MHRVVRRALRPIAAVTFVAIALAVSLSCVNAAGLVAGAQACCEAMSGGCGGTMARDHGCCSSEAGDQAFQQVAGSKSFGLQQPVLSLVATIAFLEANAYTGAATRPLLRESHGSPPGSRDVPTYLALSTIRV